MCKLKLLSTTQPYPRTMCGPETTGLGFAAIYRPLFTFLFCLVVSFGCGLANPSEGLSAASPLRITTHSLYSAWYGASQTDRAAAAAATSRMPLLSYYQDLLNSARDGDLTIDTTRVTLNRDEFARDAGAFADLARAFPTVGDVWGQTGYDPVAMLTETDFSSMIKAAVAARVPSGQSGLGLLGQAASCATDMFTAMLFPTQAPRGRVNLILGATDFRLLAQASAVSPNSPGEWSDAEEEVDPAPFPHGIQSPFATSPLVSEAVEGARVIAPSEPKPRSRPGTQVQRVCPPAKLPGLVRTQATKLPD